MKKRIAAFLGVMALVFGTLTCFAAEMRASHYFDGYILGMAARGNGKMVVEFTTMGTGVMDQIGAYSIRVEEEFTAGEWVTSFTAYGDSDPDTFYSYDTYDHTGEFTFYGTPGVRYRAVMVSYARNSSGEEYSREITCTARECK